MADDPLALTLPRTARLDPAETLRGEILAKLLANPRLCHEVLFEHRHPDASPPFLGDMIDDWWDMDLPACGEEIFRGGAKSTTAEEAICAQALFQRFKYALIVGNSYSRAVERLAAIKHEISTNGHIIELFQDQQGETWSEGEIILKNGVKLQAIGARQSLRGAKHWTQRPDMLFIDDLEDEENVDTKEQREKMSRWLFRSLLPVCDPKARKRVVGTPLGPEAVLEKLRKQSGWPFRVVPIVVPAVTDSSQWTHSNWEARFPLSWIKAKRDELERVGELQGFVQEYLCQSEEQALKPFQPRHIVTAQAIPEWAPALIVVDPARTTNTRTSARTGYIVFSWLGHKLYVRHAKGEFHKPNEIIEEIFRLDRLFQPIHIGVEKDGLEEFLMQPLRQKVLESGAPLSLVPLNAPRDRTKHQFILGLQPFFEAGDIQMCGEFPDLVNEILGFPTGRVDVLNSLAYALRMRAGKPVYDDFGIQHVAPELQPTARPLPKAWLTVNVAPSHTAAALVQYTNGCLRIFADWVVEGGVGEALERLLPEAYQAANGLSLQLIAPAEQFDAYNNLGLQQALRRWQITPTHGPAAAASVGSLAPHLRARPLQQPVFLVARAARWTANALAGGYARGLNKGGVLNEMPEQNYYNTLMGGLESFAKFLTVQGSTDDAVAVNWQPTGDGRRYMSSRPVRQARGRGSE